MTNEQANELAKNLNNDWYVAYLGEYGKPYSICLRGHSCVGEGNTYEEAFLAAGVKLCESCKGRGYTKEK
jgi:hypothetical protein